MSRMLGLILVVVLSLGWARRLMPRWQWLIRMGCGAHVIRRIIPWRSSPTADLGSRRCQTPCRRRGHHGSIRDGPRDSGSSRRHPPVASAAACARHHALLRVSRAAAQSQYPLPTGSLDWPAANGVILYSPALRYQTYGDGYGRGPYGSVDCGIMYKGWRSATDSRTRGRVMRCFQRCGSYPRRCSWGSLQWGWAPRAKAPRWWRAIRARTA